MIVPEDADCRLTLELGAEWKAEDLPCRVAGNAVELPWLPDGRYRIELGYQRRAYASCSASSAQAPFESKCTEAAFDPRETWVLFGWTRFDLHGAGRDDLRIELQPTATIRLEFRVRRGDVPVRKSVAYVYLDTTERLSYGAEGKWTAPDVFEFRDVPAPAAYSLTIRSADGIHYAAAIEPSIHEIAARSEPVTVRIDYRRSGERRPKSCLLLPPRRRS